MGAQQGLRELSHEREHLKELQEDLAGVQSLVQAASQLQAGGGRLAEVLHSSTQAAGSRAQAITRVCEDLRGLCETQRQELEEEKRKIARQQEVADAQHMEALKLLNTYSDRLGLVITRVAPQTVRMNFSLLNECNPEEDASFTLGIENDESKTSDCYCVSECKPEVPELSALVAALNADTSSVSALPRFVCSMRRAFIKSLGGV